MLYQSSERPGAPAAMAAARRDEHRGIRTISRLVLLCTIGLITAAMLLITTAFQVLDSLDQADLMAERQRAANAIDAMTATDGPLDAQRANLLGRLAGLRDAHLSTTIATDPAIQQIPLVAGQGSSGSYLTWQRSTDAETIFRRFAPIRLPIIGGMLLLMLGVLIKLRSVVADIERQRRLALRQSRSDPLTGVANRLALETTLADLAANATPFAVIALDLDRFKDVNDALGHGAGDEVLRTIGARLSRLLEGDELLARVGGDEFVMVTTSRVGRDALAAFAQSAIAAIERPLTLGGSDIRVGASLGLVSGDRPLLSPEAAMALADAALYRAKARTGSGFQFAASEESWAPQDTQRLSA